MFVFDAAQMKEGDADVEINSVTLKEYLDANFEFFVNQRYSYPNECEPASKELRLMGIGTISELEQIIPENFTNNALRVYQQEMSFSSSYIGLIRTLLMINNISGYFENAWEQKWDTIDRPQITLLKTYAVNIEDYIENYDLEII